MGLMNKTGKIVVPCKYNMYSRIGNLNEISSLGKEFIFDNLICVGSQEKYGYIDTTGKLVIPYQFDSALSFSEGLACVGKNAPGELNASEFAYIGKTGKIVIPYRKAMYASDFENGLAYIRDLDENAYYIDKTGKKISNYYRGK